MRWGWVCNAQWVGLGKSFNVSIPVREAPYLQGMKYNPKANTIELWGYYGDEKYMSSLYNGRPLNGSSDIGHPESKEDASR
jgi:hypothetical protein